MEDGFDEDIEFGDEISDDDEDDVDNASAHVYFCKAILITSTNAFLFPKTGFSYCRFFLA